MVTSLTNNGEPHRAREHVLVPTDFSAASQSATRKAAAVARRLGGMVLLLHVIDLNAHTPPVGPANDAALRAELYTAAREQLDRQVAELKAEAIPVKPRLREGLPAEEIIQVADECDLIVFGKPRPRPFWHWFSRRTVETVLKTAPCSVLLVCDKEVECSGGRP